MPDNKPNENENKEQHQHQRQKDDDNWHLRRPEIIIEDNDGDPDTDE